MKNLVKLSLLAAMAVAPVMADESFGGIGVTIYQIHEGVKVAEVIPGTPAAETKLQAGDVITAVDGVSLQGKDIEASKDMLRGQVNKPLEITYVSEGETYKETLRRTQITVKEFEGQSVQSWYGDKEKVNSHELEAFASASQSDKQLVAVLQNGNLVKEDVKASSAGINGVYIEKVNEFEPKVQKNNVVRTSSATLRGFTREAVSFGLKSSGTAVVSILSADGELVATLRADNAKAGINTISWDGSQLTSGRYMVSIDHNGSVSGTMAVLK
jgi:membrane-associated protease RseP (regulator of RpoE activity)